jgi:hypothetical protein
MRYAASSDLASTELDAFVAAFRKAAAKERGQTSEILLAFTLSSKAPLPEAKLVAEAPKVCSAY